jgi:two-component system response regulator RegA
MLLGSDQPAVRTLVIVEDDTALREALTMILSSKGYDVKSVATVELGLALLQWNPSHLILDLKLSEGFGTAILKVIRDEKLPIRVAVSTGSANAVLLAEVYRLAPDIVFRKPYATADLLDWLRLSAAVDSTAALPAATVPTGC